MAEEQRASGAGEMMIFGLIEQADRMGKSAQATQRALTGQIEQLAAIQARAEVTLRGLVEERMQLQSARAGLERHAAQAIQEAVRQQSGEIERQTKQTLARPLQDIQSAAAQVLQNVRESSVMFVVGIFIAGVMLGLFAAYFFIIRTQNTIDDRLGRIEQVLATPAQPAVATHASPAPSRKGKSK